MLILGKLAVSNTKVHNCLNMYTQYTKCQRVFLESEEFEKSLGIKFVNGVKYLYDTC